MIQQDAISVDNGGMNEERLELKPYWDSSWIDCSCIGSSFLDGLYSLAMNAFGHECRNSLVGCKSSSIYAWKSPHKLANFADYSMTTCYRTNFSHSFSVIESNRRLRHSTNTEFQCWYTGPNWFNKTRVGQRNPLTRLVMTLTHVSTRGGEQCRNVSCD